MARARVRSKSAVHVMKNVCVERKGAREKDKEEIELDYEQQRIMGRLKCKVRTLLFRRFSYTVNNFTEKLEIRVGNAIGRGRFENLNIEATARKR